jgi:hypothetical protein
MPCLTDTGAGAFECAFDALLIEDGEKFGFDGDAAVLASNK